VSSAVAEAEPWKEETVQSTDWEITVLVLSLRIVLAILEIVKARRGNGEPTHSPD